MRTESLPLLTGQEPAPAHAVLLEDLQRERGQALFGFARRLGLSDDEAADAVQETLLRLWRELDRGTPVNDRPAWAFRTLYRLAMDEHRVRRRLAGLRTRLAAGARAHQGVDRDDRITVWAAVDRLPERQRHALYLRYRADLPFDDIALVLGVSTGAARTIASRAVDRLRRQLAEPGEPK